MLSMPGVLKLRCKKDISLSGCETNYNYSVQ